MHEQISVFHKKVALDGLEHLLQFAVFKDQLKHLFVGPFKSLKNGLREVFESYISIQMCVDIFSVGILIELFAGFEDVNVLASDENLVGFFSKYGGHHILSDEELFFPVGPFFVD